MIDRFFASPLKRIVTCDECFSLLLLYSISHLKLDTTHIGYAQTFEEAYERHDNLYKEETMGIEHVNPPVDDFLVWRDLRVFDGKEVPCPFFFNHQLQICSLSK